MAKIEEAYSLEYGEVIDAEKAYELYWDGLIQEKRAFKCPGCSLKITAANIDKERTEMKNTPHFRAYGVHDFECSYEFEIDKESRSGDNKKNKKQLTIDKQVDSLFLERPNNHQYVNHSMNVKSSMIHNDKESSLNNNRINKNYQKKSNSYYSIKPLVSKFIKYKIENKLTENFINIKGYSISYADMFTDLTQVNLSHISKYKRFYYGDGEIVRSSKNNGDYIIFFKPGITNKDNKTTSLYISNEMIQKTLTHNKWISVLNNLTENPTRVRFFAYCKISNRDKGSFINLTNLSNLDFFEFRLL
jgi:DNA-directed RNA polymerase subunit RPC12/RpoP